jgi:hypothetical protein
MLYLIKVHSIFKNNNNGNRGYEPQSKLWKRFIVSLRVSCPSLRGMIPRRFAPGIVRLANLTAL